MALSLESDYDTPPVDPVAKTRGELFFISFEFVACSVYNYYETALFCWASLITLALKQSCHCQSQDL